MNIGICIDPSKTLDWSSVPGNFLEANVQTLFMPEADEDLYTEAIAKFADSNPRVEAANCFLPADLKVSGPGVDEQRLARYADTAFRRASAFGTHHIVFGSGGARQIPEGTAPAEGFEQFIRALEICAPLAQKHGITLLVEPLNRGECNLVNTILEGAVAVARVNHPHIRLLVDFFHMLRNGEPPEDIVKVGPWVAHAHIAEAAERTAPGVKGDDFRAFFAALKRIHYTGALSIECILGENPQQTLEAAVTYLRNQL